MENHEQHSEIMRAVGRLEGKIDGINNRLDTLNGRVGKSEDKVNTLESFRDGLLGKMSVLSIIIGGGVSLLIAYFKDKI